jgi:hypothetical protein
MAIEEDRLAESGKPAMVDAPVCDLGGGCSPRPNPRMASAVSGRGMEIEQVERVCLSGRGACGLSERRDSATACDGCWLGPALGQSGDALAQVRAGMP